MSQYTLKISDLYDLLIGGGYKLFIDSEATPTNIHAVKRWNGTDWVLVYDNTRRFLYYNGTGWINASLK
jgi:hypothetical protein